jgi:hypothetical protein
MCAISWNKIFFEPSYLVKVGRIHVILRLQFQIRQGVYILENDECKVRVKVRVREVRKRGIV